MTENTENKKVEKKEIVVVPAIREFDNTKTLITNIGAGRGAETKYEIIFDVPETDEQAEARYGCSLMDIIRAGIRNLSTHVQFNAVGFEDDGSLKPNGHKAMQDLADGYKVGRQAGDGGSKAKKARTVKAIEEETGMTLEQLHAKMAELKKAGLI